ncbi:carboxypeptidase-like regulatory domain-containing protein [uncultured Paludibaculum sp.]|uniref:MSCRAMM family protein n=1 Tax=uncultured Paludibaculum sp. TaxID=1765020 RepID=UPI002AAA9431|nr:carboxypeptidase-like regulatory domain-containing protein [uncultured Paludibaculum sp.]
MRGRLLFTSVALVAAQHATSGCMFYSGTPVDHLKRANHVFVGRVLHAEGSLTLPGPVTFLVEEAFKGIDKGATITAGAGEPRCGGISFRESERYLLFLGPASAGQLPDASRLSGTIGIDEAPAVLRWLRGRNHPSWKVQILGVALGVDDVSFKRNARPLKGAKITIAGHGKRVTATSDSEGIYQIGGLPPGEYQFSGSYPGLDVVPGRVLIGECCVFRDISAWVDGHVGGTVRDAEGHPLADIRVELITAQTTGSPSPFRNSQTNSQGEFLFRGIPPGQYLLGVSVLNGPTNRQPYPRTTRPVTLSPRQELIGLDLRTPAPLAPRDIVVKVLAPDGRGAPDAAVYIQTVPGYTPSESVRTNGHGEARITWIQGAAFKCYAETRTATGPTTSSDWQETAAGDQPVQLTLQMELRKYQ